jgi:hypothetical protein
MGAAFAQRLYVRWHETIGEMFLTLLGYHQSNGGHSNCLLAKVIKAKHHHKQVALI